MGLGAYLKGGGCVLKPNKSVLVENTFHPEQVSFMTVAISSLANTNKSLRRGDAVFTLLV